MMITKISLSARYGYRGLGASMSLLLLTITAAALQPADLVIDAFASATSINIQVKTPNLSLSTPSGAPAIVSNGNQKSIQAVVGQPVTIDIGSSDPLGYNGFVFAGITQNNQFYYNPSQYIVAQGSGLALQAGSGLLPTGSTLSNRINTVGNYTQSVFTWTPTAADTNTSVTVTFIASNYYHNTAPMSNTQSVTVNTVENTAPSFSMSATETLMVGVEARIPVTVLPDTDNNAVNITAQNLPAGATLGTAAKNANGQWVAVLTWQPTVSQLGSTTVTFLAEDVNETNQVSNPVEFIVQNNSSPAFVTSMPTTVGVAQNDAFSYPVSVIPDSSTSNVLITATGLPAGATLSQPALVNGRVVATMNWRPDASQIGSDFQVTFTAEDNVAGAVPVMFTANFKVLPHYSVINQPPVRKLRR